MPILACHCLGATACTDKPLLSTATKNPKSEMRPGVTALNKGFDAHYDAQKGYLTL